LKLTDIGDGGRTFEKRLNLWIQRLEATTTSSDPLWKEASSLREYIQNLTTANPRMVRLGKHLDSALNILLGQSVQRERLVKQIRASKQQLF
jgi:hypothetical protein